MQSLDRGQKSTFSYDVEGFADFLSANKALATLLFWKDAEEYSTLFGSDERKNTAEKICKRCIRSHPLPQWPSFQQPCRLQHAGREGKCAPQSYMCTCWVSGGGRKGTAWQLWQNQLHAMLRCTHCTADTSMPVPSLRSRRCSRR